METSNKPHHRQVLDLNNLIRAIKQQNPNFTAKTERMNGYKTRFKPTSTPPNLGRVILKYLIYAKYGSLEPFAKQIGKTKMWVHYLIYKPYKVQVKPETNQRINEALGVDIIF